SDAVTGALNKVLLRQQLARSGATAGAADALMQPAEVQPVRGSHHRDRASSMVSIGALFFLMYLVIMLYGMNVARSVIEEKTSRIFEVMLAAVRPEEMMAGKIIGVGAVGITQMGIWLAAIFLAAGSSSGINIGGETIHPSLTGPQVAYFLVFFLLGYLFYSAIAAALGAMTNSEQELQQMNIFLMLPLLMYMRVSLGHPHAWETILSITMLAGSTAVLIWLTSRIYRVGVLMYGKRPS